MGSSQGRIGAQPVTLVEGWRIEGNGRTSGKRGDLYMFQPEEGRRVARSAHCRHYTRAAPETCRVAGRRAGTRPVERWLRCV